tara:strand:- start:437 stop:994 length:558 start_codon:yes stop_codon:yes gene_type:complete
MLGACDAVDQGTTLLAGIAPPEDAALPAVPLTQALMMRGNVTLVPPTGYCVDPENLSQSFALMARCDNMGAATGGEGSPAGVLTVSLARNGLNPKIPTAEEVAAAAGVSAPEKARQTDTSVIFRTKGTAPSSDLSPTHWRSVSKVGKFTMGASLFGPEGRRAITDEGATLLEEMIKRTTDKTNTG